MSSTIANIYIPSIHVNWTRSQIADIFAKAGVGNVLRIDFVRTVAKPLENDTRTFDERTNKQFRQAFIRVDVGDHHDSPFVGLQPNMQIRLYPLTSVAETPELRGYRTNKGNLEFWMCLGAANPLVDSDLSIDEIIENLRDLFPRLETSEDNEVYNYMLKQACLLRDKHPSYQNVSELNRHQLDNNTKMLAKRIAERISERDIPAKE